jgi:hypothetical protein
MLLKIDQIEKQDYVKDLINLSSTRKTSNMNTRRSNNDIEELIITSPKKAKNFIKIGG